MNACLCLGTWQGIFLWEHRNVPSQRKVVLMFQGLRKKVFTEELDLYLFYNLKVITIESNYFSLGIA